MNELVSNCIDDLIVNDCDLFGFVFVGNSDLLFLVVFVLGQNSVLGGSSHLAGLNSLDVGIRNE